MAFEDMMNIVSIAPTILRDMPVIMGIIQFVGYIFLSLFFGSIALKGYRGYANAWVRFGLKLGIGFFCLVMGLTISGFLPVTSASPLILMIQRDIINNLVGGLIASFSMMGAVYLVTHNIFDLERMEAALKRFQERVRKAEQVKREEDKKPLAKRIADPYRIAGIAVVTIMVLFVFTFFAGFPSLSESILSSMGLTQEDIDQLLEQLGANQETPAGCESLLVILQQHGDDIVNNRLPKTSDPATRKLISSQGHEPISMYELVHNGDNYVIAVTADSYMCYIREGALCGCMDVSSFVTISN